MLHKVNILFLVFFSLSLNSFSQEEDSLENQLTYHKEMSGMLFMHTHGYGLNLRKGYHVAWDKKRVFEIDFCSMMHAKNYVISASQISNTKSYTYGELNSVGILRMGYGMQKLLAGKTLKNNVEIRWLYQGGFSLALLKPVYFELDMPGDEVKYARFTNESKNYIKGGASYAMGINELSLIPGIYGKTAFAFEYASKYNYLRALEIGLMIDAYYKVVPILAETKNYPYFVSFYLGFTYGKKWYR